MNNVTWLKIKRLRNKIFALFFSGLAIALFVLYFVLWEIQYDWAFFRTDPSYLWTLFCVGIPYIIIFVCNIRNDNFAYIGIMMFVFLIAFSSAFDAITFLLSLGFAILPIITLGLIIATAIIGFILYSYILRYQRYTIDDFKKVRIFAIVYACLLLVQVIVSTISDIITYGTDPIILTLLVGFALSEALMGVAVIFTLERLRRI